VVQGSQPLFLRTASLTLINLRTAQRLDIQKLRFTFSFERSVESTPNQGKLQIYNLSERSRNFCNIPPEAKGAPTRKGLFVELQAGYQGLVRTILTGNATGGSEYLAPDWVTNLEILDGEAALRQSTFQRSYPAGFSVNRIIQDVVQSFGLPVGYVKPVITADVVSFGQTFNTSNRKVLDDFAAKYKFRWNVQNGAINLFDRDTGLLQPAVQLTPRTGLIGSPIRTDKGINFKCLLIPLIVPGGKVRLEQNTVYTGELLVQKIVYTGDTHGSDWTLDVEATII
jgi:hypothetical protein